MGTLREHGSEEQRQADLPAVARGELRLSAFGVTVPAARGDTLSIAITAVKEGDCRETCRYQAAPVSTNLIRAGLGEHVLGMPRIT